MNLDAPDPAELLRGRGLRVTPQRRAILAAFEGGPSEHLSADEVHAHAAADLPDLGRGTVYATLAEFTELGLLSAFGAPEPVRYETNTEPHDHFRCRLCLRLFDVETTATEPVVVQAGFKIERVEIRVEGVCADCDEYDSGLDDGVAAIARRSRSAQLFERRGVAASSIDSPLGPLLLAASPEGLLRLAFEHDGDVPRLRELVASRRGSRAARAHLADATRELDEYFAGTASEFACAIDWDGLAGDHPEGLRALEAIPYAGRASYDDLPLELTPRALGEVYGANPIPIVTACHRVTRGVEVPEKFVGGPERRRWLLAHEQRTAAVAQR